MNTLADALTPDEQAALADPATVVAAQAIRDSLIDLTAAMVEVNDALASEPAVGVLRAKQVVKQVAELSDRDARHVLVAALEQLAVYVIADRTTLVDGVEADEPPC